MKNFIIHLLSFSLIFSNAFPSFVRAAERFTPNGSSQGPSKPSSRGEDAKNQDSKKNHKNQKEDAKSGTKPNWTWGKPSEEDAKSGAKPNWTWGKPSEEGPSEKDLLGLEIPSKASFLVQRSLILAVQQVIASRYQNGIEEHYRKLYEDYGGYIRNSANINDFSIHFQNQISQRIFLESYQDILNRAHEIATSNLALWSKQAESTGRPSFKKDYNLYEMIQPGIELAFRRLADPKNSKGVRSSILALIHSIVTDHMSRSASLEFQPQKLKPRDLNDLLKDVDETSASRGSQQALVPQGSVKRSQTLPGSTSKVLIDLGSVEPESGPMLTKMDVEIPEIDIKEVLKQNPETIKYKLRRPLAGAEHFAAQSILFNIPLFFITVALVGLDSAKNPQAIEQFAASLKDPAVHMGFALFMLTNHKVAVGFEQVVKNPKLHFMGKFLGMAAGMLAQSIFSDLWNDQDIRGCARSMYVPSAENADSCNNAWNSWMLTNKISQYTPTVLGLLSTAFAAGVAQKFGTAAISAATKGVKMAEAELAALKEASLKGAVNLYEDPLLVKAKQKLELAKENLRVVKQFTEPIRQKFGSSLASAQGRLGFRIKGLWSIPKNSFKDSIDLEAYLLKMKKLKGIVNFSLVTLGTNLVFLALDPFISEPLHEMFGKNDLNGFNLKQALDHSALDNYHEVIGAYFSHKVALPHEKDFKTLPDILEAYNRSLEANITNNFKGYDLLSCYAGAPNGEGDSSPSTASAKLEGDSFLDSSILPEVVKSALKTVRQKGQSVAKWSADSNRAVGRYILNQGLYAVNPECVVKSNFKTWLEKYAEAEKGWRTLTLSQVLASSNAWTETIANFITNYETTDKFYQHMFTLINLYRFNKANGLQPELPTADLTRSILQEKVKEISQVPLRSEWGEDTRARYEKLFPESMESFETPEYADYLIASMACGPDPKASVSFMQNLRSLSWFPWESLSRMAPSVFSTWQTVKPNSSIIETYPGTSFKYIAPRVTPGNPSDLCGESKQLSLIPNKKGFGPEAPMGLYQRPIVANGIQYKNLIHYIFENAHSEIVNANDVVNKFTEWNLSASTNPIFDEQQGVWPVVKQNYENLMKHHFLPALTKSTMETGCPLGGGLHCGFNDDIYLRANGVIYSGVNEIYTYIRTLRKIARYFSNRGEGAFKVSEQWMVNEMSPVDETAFSVHEQREQLKSYMDQNFEKQAKAVVFALMDKRTDPKDLFDYSYAIQKLGLFQEDYLSKLPNSTEGVAAMDMATQVFEKLSAVVEEIQSYKGFAQLNFEKGAEPLGAPRAESMGNPYDPRSKGAHRVGN